jgi:mono/diheme cytochrome c family protein
LAETLAAQGRASFFQRLEHGGERMPVFDHLSAEEIDAQFLYLEQLADVPGARARPAAQVKASVARVGELLVKGTCHTCHAAAGRGGGPEVLQRGVIPSLDTFPEQKSVSFLVHKVREGAPIAEGWSGRGRMPVFSYLTDDEVRAAYDYLVLSPPEGR